MAEPREPGSSSNRFGSIGKFYDKVKNAFVSIRQTVTSSSKMVSMTMKLFVQALQKFPNYLKSGPPQKAKENPKTAADFKQNLDIIVRESGLGKFYKPDDPFLLKVAERAAKLRKDPDNPLNKPNQLEKLTRIALYQPILYCDDSGSMEGDRMRTLKELATQIVSVATRAIPENNNKGLHLRFINGDDKHDDLKTSDLSNVKFEVRGATEIGTNLERKILKPFVYDVVDANKPLPHPLLILTITDGCPWGENKSKFQEEIARCSQYLVDKGYPKEAVSFEVSQVGDDHDAEQFLEELRKDTRLKDILHCTAEHLDDKFKEYRENRATLEDWLLDMLTRQITLQDQGPPGAQ